MTAGPPIDLRAHRVLAGASRVRVLEFLQAAWPERLTAAELADGIGLHPNTVRLHLEQLVDAGLAERRPEGRGRPGRPRLLFAAPPGRPAGSPPAGDGYRALAAALAGQLARRGGSVAADAAEAGRAWARSLSAAPAAPAASTQAATDHLVRLMDGLGFAPSVPAPGRMVELHRCPFSAVAAEYPDVVCGVHLGLVEAVLEDLRAPVHATRLEPFAAPGVCRAHLAPGPAVASDPAALAAPSFPSLPTERPVP